MDYLIIGAGLAGITLKHFLKNERTVILDPNPGAYKVGESFIPEAFHHPEMHTLLPGIKRLPSFSTKMGTTFVSNTSVASFPLPIEGQEFSMHVSRIELENYMLKHWDISVKKERVRSIDFDTMTVHTDESTYTVDKQILDCSGPAMVVARALDQVIEVQPIYATWTYFDVVENDASRFWNFLQNSAREYKRYTVQRRVLPDAEEDGWDPSHSTILTQLDDGIWTWQIPLYDKKLLSFGLVSREGKISSATLFEAAEKTHMPHYTLAKRAQDNSTPFNRVHTRNHFANRSQTPATMKYIQIADASAFSDPVYSVGGGLAINKAIEVAALLNEGGWSKDKCTAWCEDFERIYQHSLDAFELWYSGAILSDDSAAQEVQNNFLCGTEFQVGVATHYSEVIASSTLQEFLEPNRQNPDAWLTHEEASVQVAKLLGVNDNSTLAGWRYHGAIAVPDGLQHRWQIDGLPELIINTKISADVTQYYRRVGDITLSFMNLWDGPYPLDARGRALFDALEAAISEHMDDWLALKP